MIKDRKNLNAMLLAALAVALIVLPGCDSEDAAQPSPETTAEQPEPADEIPDLAPITDNETQVEQDYPGVYDQNGQDNQASDDARSQRRKEYAEDLVPLIVNASTWMTMMPDWIGEKAPDFTVSDMQGQYHSLSDYNGREVIVVMWATWCGPCIQEIEHLNELRAQYNDDELAILAISDEPAVIVNDFLNDHKLDYTVLNAEEPLPAPYGQIDGLPSAFFVDSDGYIKLATMGVLSYEELEAIIQAGK